MSHIVTVAYSCHLLSLACLYLYLVMDRIPRQDQTNPLPSDTCVFHALRPISYDDRIAPSRMEEEFLQGSIYTT